MCTTFQTKTLGLHLDNKHLFTDLSGVKHWNGTCVCYWIQLTGPLDQNRTRKSKCGGIQAKLPQQQRNPLIIRTGHLVFKQARLQNFTLFCEGVQNVKNYTTTTYFVGVLEISGQNVFIESIQTTKLPLILRGYPKFPDVLSLKKRN
jgi:hypothetical protein